jgi:hypothetical protein
MHRRQQPALPSETPAVLSRLHPAPLHAVVKPGPLHPSGVHASADLAGRYRPSGHAAVALVHAHASGGRCLRRHRPGMHRRCWSGMPGLRMPGMRLRCMPGIADAATVLVCGVCMWSDGACGGACRCGGVDASGACGGACGGRPAACWSPPACFCPCSALTIPWRERPDAAGGSHRLARVASTRYTGRYHTP